MIHPDNDTIDFEILNFEILPFSKQEITLKCIPLKTGTVRLLAFFFKVFNIPRYYAIDEEFDCSDHFKTYMYMNTNKIIADEYTSKCQEEDSVAQTNPELAQIAKENRLSTQLSRMSSIQVKAFFRSKSKHVTEPSTLNCRLNRLLRE